MGAYTANYTADYPISAGLVEEGYSLSVVSGACLGGGAGSGPKGLDGLWDARDGDDFLFSRTQLAQKAQLFVRIDGVWSSPSRIPALYDRIIGGGYASNVSLTDLTELLAASLITQGQYDAALETVTQQ